MVHDQSLVAVESQFATQLGHRSADVAVADAVSQHQGTVGIGLLGLTQEGVASHLGREDKAVNGLVQLGVHVVLFGLVNAVNAHHNACVAVLADAARHHRHESVLKAVHVDDVLALAQEAGEAHG